MGSRADVGGGGLRGALEAWVAAGLAISAVRYWMLTRVDGAGELDIAVVGVAIIRFRSGQLMAPGIDLETTLKGEK